MWTKTQGGNNKRDIVGWCILRIPISFPEETSNKKQKKKKKREKEVRIREGKNNPFMEEVLEADFKQVFRLYKEKVFAGFICANILVPRLFWSGGK